MRIIDVDKYGDQITGGVLILGDATYFAEQRSNYADEYSYWADAWEKQQDIQQTQSLNSNLSDSLAYAYLLDVDLMADTNNDGHTDMVYDSGEIISGLDANNNGQIDYLEQNGIISTLSVIS